MERTRRLWAAVLCQAYEDLEREEFRSYWWNHAASFFVSDGEWADSRRTICDMLELHPHDLIRPALRIINTRRLEHGLPPLATQALQPSLGPRLPTQRVSRPVPAAPAVQLPRLVAIPAPEPERRGRAGGWRKRWAFNPFAPLPSEVRAAPS